ncbi:hypothetical protein L195_g034447, partial [Trifolium pratense]
MTKVYHAKFFNICKKQKAVKEAFDYVRLIPNPTLSTFSAKMLICMLRAGQVAIAFGAYGIMRSKNVKADRVVFNALIAACAQSGAMARAFDVIGEMEAEIQPIEPDHVTI